MYVKVSNFAIFEIFDHFREIFYPRKQQNQEINYQQNEIPGAFEILFFPNIWSKYDIDTRILHISTYNNEIRLSVTYLTITLISNSKIDIQWDFCLLFLLKSSN